MGLIGCSATRFRAASAARNPGDGNFAALKAELDEILEKELPETGAQRETLKKESERVMEYAQTYVKQIEEQQKKEMSPFVHIGKNPRASLILLLWRVCVGVVGI